MLGSMLIRFEFYFPLFKSMAMHVNDFETTEDKFKPGIERKDYAFEVTILIIENIRKILWPCNPTTPQPPPYSLQSMGK